MIHVHASLMEDWRASARGLILAEVSPENVRWIDAKARRRDGQIDLFVDDASPDPIPSPVRSGGLNVPSAFIAQARTVTHHRSGSRWELLYRMLWRLTHGEPHLMNVASDSDVVQALAMEKAVRRDAHKMKAFVRFRKTTDDSGAHYVAWHRCDHYSARYTAEFFARRFDVMRWTILTPDESVSWDRNEIRFGPGVPRSEAPSDDELEVLWKTYYANIFNPARIKLKAMQAEMPKKYWATMPETELIDQLVRQAPARVDKMVEMTQGVVTAQSFLPEPPTESVGPPEIGALREAARDCRGCELCTEATQTVFGVGPQNAEAVIIGEQPGDQEDLSGEPFVGPAGQLLKETLGDVGLEWDRLYVTNVVKHFKFTRSGKRRLHKRPSSRDVAACRPWLDAEIDSIRPRFVLCLGVTAAQAVLGPNFRLSEQRGNWFETGRPFPSLATYHPSALLRITGDKAAQMKLDFHLDLQRFATAVRRDGLPGRPSGS